MSHIDSNNVITIETDPDEHDDRDRKRRKGEAGLALDIVSSDGTVRSHRFESPAKPGPPPPRARASYAQSTVERPSDKVIEIPDPKSVKQAIVDSWIAYTPQQIVKLIKKCYPNVATASSQLSNLKSVLVGLANPPPEDWLAQLRLSRKEYKELANAYREKRDKQGRNLQFHTVHDSDVLVQRSLEMMTSSDYRVLWPALVVCSGFRPVEVLTANIKETPNSSNHIHPGFWVCVSNWAKKKRGSDFCRDHPLAPLSKLAFYTRNRYREKIFLQRTTYKAAAEPAIQQISITATSESIPKHGEPDTRAFQAFLCSIFI
jgi:hypothetical protein